jgi:ABC-type transport system involved in multi-copper enzyme maturation permease subunit
MIWFTVRQIVKHKIMWVWLILSVLMVLVIGIWGNVQTAAGNIPLLVMIGKGTIPATMLLRPSLGVIIIICIIAYSKYYADVLKPEQAVLIFSKPVSRTQFFFSNFTAVLLVSLLYTLFMGILFAIVTGIKAGSFPILFYLAGLIYVPFYVLVYYIAVVFFITITKSRLAGALIGYFILGVSPFLLPTSFITRHAHSAITITGLPQLSPYAKGVVYFFRYVIPSSSGVKQLWLPVLHNGFGMFHWELFGFIIATCAPFFIISYLMAARREF